MSLQRILLVDTNARSIQVEQDALVRMGVLFDSCVGPTVPGGCPLLRGENCPKLERAGGLIFQLDFDQSINRNLLMAYVEHSAKENVPLCVVETPQLQTGRPIQSGTVSWFPPMLLDDLDEFATRIKSRSREGADQGEPEAIS